MKAQAIAIVAGAGLALVAGCTSAPGHENLPPPVPPAWAEQDRTAYNNQQVALFVSRDPGWQAWLNAMLMSQHADDALVDASRLNTPVLNIIKAITIAQDSYRVATSFNLPPFTLTSGCGDLYPETTGAVQLPYGLIVRYGFLMSISAQFGNGSSCLTSIGFIDEVDSSRGLAISTADRNQPFDWTGSFSRYLVWSQPFWRLSTGTTLSQSDMVGLIER